MEHNDKQARIARMARDAAARGETLDYACPYPFDTAEGQHFKAMHQQARAAALVAAPVPADQPQVQVVDELAHTVRRLAHALRQFAPSNDLPAKALDYLKRHGLQGSVLRTGDADA